MAGFQHAIGWSFEVPMDVIRGGEAIAWWYNPRTVETEKTGVYPAKDIRFFTPTTLGENLDWVLILDDASKNYNAPERYKGETN